MEETSAEKSPAKAVSIIRTNRSSKGKDQEPESPVAGSSKKGGDDETAIVPDFPSAPVLRTEKEKAAWEKYKDQFQTLCAALKNEGVEVMLVASPDKGSHNKGVESDKKTSDDKENSRGNTDGDDMAQDRTDESENEEENEQTSTENKRRGRPSKTKVDEESDKIKSRETKKRGRPSKTAVETDENNDDENKEDSQEKKTRERPNVGEAELNKDDEVDSHETHKLDQKTGGKGSEVKRGRGRPPKTPKSVKTSDQVDNPENVEKRGRTPNTATDNGKARKTWSTPVCTPAPLVSSRSGRIRKTPARYLDSAVIEVSDTEENKNSESEEEEDGEKSGKGKRGRPKKIVIKTEPNNEDYEKAAAKGVKEKTDDNDQNEADAQKSAKKSSDKSPEGSSKGKRGRPRKSVGGEKGETTKNDAPAKKVMSVKKEPSDNDAGYGHKRTVRKKDNFKCENCDKEFILECLLDRHLRTCTKKTPTVEKTKKKTRDGEDGEEAMSGTENIPATEKGTDTSDMDGKMDGKMDGEDEELKEEVEGETTKKRKREDDEDSEEMKKQKTLGDESDEEKNGESNEVFDSLSLSPKKACRGRPRRQIYKEDYDDDNDGDFLPDRLKKARKNAMKKFSQTDLLYMQMNISDDEIECKICSKTFKDVKYLRRHMTIHAGIRDFVCKICRKSFMRKYDLHIHMIRVHSWVKTGRGKIKTEDDLEEGEITLDTPKSKKLERTSEDSGGDDDDACEGENVVNEEESQENVEHQFSCEICEKKFRFESSLKIHVQTHTDTKSFLCDLCGKGFSLEKYLDKHRLRHEKEGIVSVEGDKKIYHCQVCEKTFQILTDYQTHMKSHKDENLRTFHCDQCPKGFFKLAHLKRHLLTHTTDRTYKCALCDKRYKDPDTLRKHQKCVHQVKDETTGEVMEKKAWPCDECGKVFFNSGHLKRHKFRHTGERPFPCTTCGKSFAEKKSLENHTRIHTGDRPYHCEECGRRFIQMSHLRRHKYLHTQIRNYECPQCKKRFFENTDLMKHIRVHSNIRPFKCDLCHMSFAQKNVLVCHRRRHTGEKPFICDICSRGFTQLGSLQTHRRLHTGERPYKCQYCDQGFVSKERMKFHSFIHTGITPHICHICGKGFRLKFKLQSHIDSHEGVFRHKCPYCAKGFLERAKLNRHMKQVHNEDRQKSISVYGYKGNIVKMEQGSPTDDVENHQEIIIRNLGHFDAKDNNSEEVIETTYVTIPSELTEGQDHETDNAISHITLDASEVSAATAANIGALFDGTTNSITIPQDSIIYEGEGGSVGEEVVYVVIPEENQTVILS